MPNYSRSSLDDLDQREFMRKLRAGLLKRVGQGGQAQNYTGGPTGEQFGMMSGTPESPESVDAMTRRKVANAQYGKYGQGGLVRERLGADVAMNREGLTSAEKIAGIQAGAHTGAAGIQAGAQRDVAGLEGQTNRDVAGINARMNLGVAEMQFGPQSPAMVNAQSTRMLSEQPMIAQGKDIDGNPVFQAFDRSGQPIVKRPGEMDWVGTVANKQFKQAAQVIQNSLKGKKPEEIDMMIDDIFKKNPALGEYLRENPLKPAPDQEAIFGGGTARRGVGGGFGKPAYTVSDLIGDVATYPARAAYQKGRKAIQQPIDFTKKVLSTELPAWLKIND